jgi:hypothetical protein
MLNRLSEPSTWAALAAAFGTMSAGAPAGAAPYLWAATALCTVAGILLGEKPKSGGN